MIDIMAEKKGESLEEWKKILKEKACEKPGESVKYLKTKHGVTHGFADTIVSLSKEENQSSEDLVEMQCKGKGSLLPI
ncbi:MAG: DUF4287 domain-containing protein [Reichenbachiella sp.]|uniref:DUF4287 domain-containing protein n=1 Tax=Reichenbachiella sp. TaxID=2184521 RepID=UPI0032996D6C